MHEAADEVDEGAVGGHLAGVFLAVDGDRDGLPDWSRGHRASLAARAGRVLLGGCYRRCASFANPRPPSPPFSTGMDRMHGVAGCDQGGQPAGILAPLVVAVRVNRMLNLAFLVSLVFPRPWPGSATKASKRAIENTLSSRSHPHPNPLPGRGGRRASAARYRRRLWVMVVRRSYDQRTRMGCDRERGGCQQNGNTGDSSIFRLKMQYIRISVDR